MLPWPGSSARLLFLVLVVCRARLPPNSGALRVERHADPKTAMGTACCFTSEHDHTTWGTLHEKSRRLARLAQSMARCGKLMRHLHKSAVFFFAQMFVTATV